MTARRRIAAVLAGLGAAGALGATAALRAPGSPSAVRPAAASTATPAVLDAELTLTSGAIPSTPPGPTVSRPTCLPRRLDVARSFVQGLLTVRLVALDRVDGETEIARRLTASDRATLQQEIDTDRSGMQSLQQEVAAATTCAAVVQDAQTMVTRYRVFYVMVPKTDLVTAADIESSIAAQLAGYDPRIQAAIARARAAGRPVTGAETAFSSLEAEVRATDTQVNGLAANVLAQEPAGSPGNWDVFVGAHQQVVQARTDLVSAVADLHTVVADLR